MDIQSVNLTIQRIIQEEVENCLAQFRNNESTTYPLSKFLSVKDAAKFLGLKPQTIYNRIYSNTIPYYKDKFTHKPFFKMEELEAMMKKQDPVETAYDKLRGTSRKKSNNTPK